MVWGWCWLASVLREAFRRVLWFCLGFSDFPTGFLIFPPVLWFSHRFSDFPTGSRFSRPLKNPLNSGVLSPKFLFNLEAMSNKSSFVDIHDRKPLRFADVRKFQFWLFSLSSRISWPLITESLYLSDVPKLRLFCNTTHEGNLPVTSLVTEDLWNIRSYFV